MPSSVEGIMAKACAACGVYGLFRAGEMTFKGKRYPILQRSDVTWRTNSVEIRLRNSKTDYLRRGVTIHLTANGSPSCPFSLLQMAWKRAPNQRPDAALFQTKSGSPLHYKALLKAIKRAISALGITGNYGGHSLRAGGATTLALMGYPDSLIKILGRWKSLSYQRYIKLDLNTFRDVSLDMAKQGRRAQPFGGLPGRSPICQS
jgi:site-specific recombinase XerD